MSRIFETPFDYSILKQDLPPVHEDSKGRPFVKIPDPDNPGEVIHFISLPGDGPQELVTLALAYLALAQHAAGPVDAGEYHGFATNGLPGAFPEGAES
jgi:hypothetical protein